MTTTKEDDATRYRVKSGVAFAGRARGMVMQSRNGPCPLLAVANVLLLRGELDSAVVTGGGDSRFVAGAMLTQLVADRLLARKSPSAAVETAAADALRLLPSLSKGLDVNVRFTDGSSGFEFTEAMSLFDLADVPLLHAWLCDPQQTQTFAALGKRSFNEVVVLGTADDEGGSILRHWLEETSSQMTVYGLVQLHEAVPEGGLAVLFRNNHFSVITKHRGHLFMLVTDEAFSDSPVMWERLQETTGDTEYLTQDFAVHKPSAAEVAALEAASKRQTVVVPSPTSTASAAAISAVPVLIVTPTMSPGGDGDMALAMQLQEQEEQQARQQQQQQTSQQRRQQGQQHQSPPHYGGNDCVLL